MHPVNQPHIPRESGGSKRVNFFPLLPMGKGVLSLLLLTLVTLVVPAPLSALTTKDENELGEKLLFMIRKEFKIIDEPDITTYIRNLGGEVLEVAGPQLFSYHFFVINNREFNAFAAPSGLIAIHSGLIEAADSEGELLSVMAHEVGHAASRHYARRLEKNQRINMGTTALALAGMILGGGSALGEAVVAGSMAGGAAMELQFSRQDEEEADRLALGWLKELERDPAEMLGMLRKMRKISRFRSNMLPPYLLTHPEPERRLSYIEDRLLMEGLPTAIRPLPGDEGFEFAFHRVKQRLYSLTRTPRELLPALEHQLKNGDKAPENFMARFGLSQVYLAERQYERSLAELDKVIARFPEQTILLTDRALILFESGEREQALTLFEQAAEGKPDNPYTLFHLAQALQQMGRADEAMPIYQRLLKITPDHAQLHFRYGQAVSGMGRVALGHYHLGLYHWYGGDARMARHHLEEAVRLAEENESVQLLAREKLDSIDHLEQ